MTTKQNLLDIAKSYLGSTTGSAGHRQLLDIYNAISPLPRGYRMSVSDAWCAAYVSAVCTAAGVDVLPECSAHLHYKINAHLKTDKANLQPGDIVYYDWNNDHIIDHVGIVESVSGGTLTVIEGNKSGRVGYRRIAASHKQVLAAIRPEYAAVKDIPDALVLAVIRGEWGNGDTRTARLTAAGYDSAAVQRRVNKWLKGN